MILGSGPNRIGQGIEFDYCCCHAAFALREEGYETVMINCNPETVSTDYDTVDRLFFEPLTFEDVSSIIAASRKAAATSRASCSTVARRRSSSRCRSRKPAWILGTSPTRSTRRDRERFAKLLWDLGIPQAASGTATTPETAREVAAKIGFPLVVRPSYVSVDARWPSCTTWRARPLHAQRRRGLAGHPILIDKFLEDAVELDVDAVADATGAVVIGGIMEHIEEAGIHSGDSSCVVRRTRSSSGTSPLSATTRSASRGRSRLSAS